MTSTHTFEDRLLSELQEVVRAQSPGQPGRPHRTRNRSIAGAAVAAAAATIGALVITSGASPAYAIGESNGTVTVTIKSLSDAAGLQRALRAKGVTRTSTTRPPARPASNRAVNSRPASSGSPAALNSQAAVWRPSASTPAPFRPANRS